MPNREELKTIYVEEGLSLEEDPSGRCFLTAGQDDFLVDSYSFEPCFYIKQYGGKMTVIHDSFTVEDLRRAAETGGAVTMVTGNTYDIRGLFRLIRKAIELGMESVDITYVEGSCFADFMREHGAASPETAIDLSEAGLRNPNSLNTFLHSKRMGRTEDGRFYLRSPKEPENGRCNRVISNQVRFGYGYREHDGRRQYFAWHGYPNRNDDFFTTAEITEAEFRQIEAEFPVQIEAGRETAELFRNRYVDRHPVILEGWNRLL